MFLSMNRRELTAGLFFLGAGIGYALWSYFTLPFGVTENMGPGYFPIVLSSILACLGVAIVFSARQTNSDTGVGHVSVRAILVIPASIGAFALLLDQMGMFATVFIAALIACFARREAKIVNALITSVGVAVFCTLVFSYGIKLPVSVLPVWIR